MEREILNAMDKQEDEDGKRSALIGSTIDEDDRPEGVYLSEQSKIMFKPREYNTGPKGVRVDEKKFRAHQALQREADLARQQEMVKKQAIQIKPIALDDEDDDEFEDDEATRRYKLERLAQMQQAATSTAHLKKFGFLELIGVEDYIDRVDGAGHPQSFVVVHLYEEYLAPSVRLNFKLEELARKYDQVCFVAVPATDAKEGLDPEELPILIAYQGGEFVSSEIKCAPPRPAPVLPHAHLPSSAAASHPAASHPARVRRQGGAEHRAGKPDGGRCGGSGAPDEGATHIIQGRQLSGRRSHVAPRA